MSGVGYREFARPGPGTKLAAVLVVLALAGVAVYAIYAPPTKIDAARAPAKSAPAVTTAPGEEPEGGGSGD